MKRVLSIFFSFLILASVTTTVDLSAYAATAATTASYSSSSSSSSKNNTTCSSHSYKVSSKATSSNNGKLKCSVCGATKTIYMPKSMSLSSTIYTYNGKAKKPTVTVKDSKGNKISSKYYTVSYISQSTGKKVSSMKNPGKYYVKVTFKTRYSGSFKKALTIKPMSTSIKSLTANKNGFTVKWEKKADNVTGYQIQYSKSNGFKNTMTVTVKKNSTTSKTVSGLKAQTTYYIRVRTYKTVTVDGKSTNLYSAWSSVKSVTTSTIASGTCGSNLTWELKDDGTLTISGTGEMTKYYSGSSVPWYPYKSSIKIVVINSGVTNIGNYAFENYTNLTSVTISDSVTSIGTAAFFRCTSLKSVSLPSSVTSIGFGAFYYCTSITSFTVSSSNSKYSSVDGVLFNKEKTELMFYPAGKSESSYIIPDSVTSIYEEAFCGCSNLKSITITQNVTSIYNESFEGCTSLTSFTVSSGNSKYTSVDGVLLNKEKTNLICCPGGKSGSYTIPNSVTIIYDEAFCRCANLKSLTIPNSVTEIDSDAFGGCTSLTDVYYGGTEADWNKIDIHSDNECLTNAVIHFSDGTIKHAKHTWNSGKTTKKATCAKTGVKTYTCTACGATKTKEIAKTSDHTWKATTKATKDKSGKLKCSVCGKTKTLNKIKSMSLSTSSYTYNAKAKKPSVTVKDSKGNKISSKYYTVSYISRSTGKTVKSMKNPGKYYVKVKFKTRYSGSLKKAVTIKPKKTSIKSVTANIKGFTVKWNKKTDKVTGYQVQYSTKKSFKGAKTKTLTIKKNSTTSKKVPNLSGKTKYYVRVRTYKTVTVDGKSTKLYSAWSSVKGVTTKAAVKKSSGNSNTNNNSSNNNSKNNNNNNNNKNNNDNNDSRQDITYDKNGDPVYK